MRCLIAILVICASVGALACSEPAAEEVRSIACDEERWQLEWPESGLPEEGTPPEWLMRPVPFVQPEGTAANTQYWLPWDFNSRQAYYVRGEDSVFFRIRFMSGTAYESTGLGRVRVFVGDRAVNMLQEGVEVSEALTPLEGGLGDVILEIPSHEFRRGLNHVNIYVRYDYGRVSRAWEYEEFGSFSVAKDSAEGVATFEETPGLVEGEYLPGYGSSTTFIGLDGRLRYLDRFLEAPEDRTSIPVSLHVQADPRIVHCGEPPSGDAIVPTMVVAFLDGERFPLGGHERVLLRLPQGVRRTIEFELQMPRDGIEHRLEILTFTGMGMPARLRGGGLFPPWSTKGHIVSTVRWGP